MTVTSTVDLRHLTQAKRQALRLLACGHTVKSISRECGLTQSAVTERLRSARRKSGIASSRELARLLAAQECWTRQTGDAPPDALGPRERRGSRWSRLRLALLGAALMIAFAVVSALVLQPSPSAADLSRRAAADPMVGGLASMRTADYAQLHARVRDETRDPQWAAAKEAALGELFGAAGALRGVPSEVRVTCAASVCEVAGRFGGSRSQVDAAMKALQAPETRKREAALGFDADADTLFGPGGARPLDDGFLVYLVRAPG